MSCGCNRKSSKGTGNKNNSCYRISKCNCHSKCGCKCIKKKCPLVKTPNGMRYVC